VLAAVFALLTSASPRVAGASETLTVTNGGVQDNFPDGMIFSVHAAGSAEITRVRLKYKVLPDGTSAIAQADITPGAQVDTTVTLDFYLSPGTVIDYSWEVTDASGATSSTETQSFFYNDIRFDWQKVTGDGLIVYHYSGSSDDAANMHGVAVQVIADAEALLGATVPFDVQVWVYDNRDDMRPALRSQSPTYDSKLITEGVKVASNTVLVLGNVSFDTLRHELTHVVTAQAGESALGSLPSWLDEGTAVHAQQDQGGYGRAIEQALRSGNVLSVREITSATGDPSKINLFYGEAGSLVSFLVDTYGQEKFAQLFADIKTGKGVDKAFEAVYGFDQDGLDNAWRVANGLSPRPTPAPTTAAPSATQIVSTTPPESDDGASTGTVIAIIAVITVLALAVGAGGITIARRL
jgi:hypothetical protein